jgi:hypothetical protein
MDSNTVLQTVEEPATQTKRCSRCGEDKPLEEFYRCNSRTDSLMSQCKRCLKAAQMDRNKGVKRCSVCGEVKQRDDFWRDSRRGRLMSVCTACMEAARSEIAQTKECSRCGKMRHISEFYADASRPDGRKGCCKECWNVAAGFYFNNTVGDYVEAQVESILRVLAESQYRLNKAELYAGELNAKQVVCREELTRICTILRTGADPVKRQCDYGRITYDDNGLSVELEPEIAWFDREQL